MGIRSREALVGGVVLAALGVASLLALRFDSDDRGTGLGANVARSEEEWRPDVTLEQLVRYRRAPNRSQFSVCVDGVGGLSVTQTEVAKVRQALDDALAIVPPMPRQVTQGCPPTSLLTGERLGLLQISRVSYQTARLVGPGEAPSTHRLFMYFVPQDVYTASLDHEPYGLALGEYSCEGDACAPLTEALYVTPAVSSDALRHAIRSAVGLARPWPDTCVATPELSWCAEFWRATGMTPPGPTPTWDPQACVLGTTQRLCDTYKVCLEQPPGVPACEEFWRAVDQTPPPPPQAGP